MNVCFIYFDEIPLKDNNKFTLNFFNEDMIQKISFNKITNYYIASLDCNLILEKHIKKIRKKFEELSKISRLLLDKGDAYQLDIGWLTSSLSSILDFPSIEQKTYNLTRSLPNGFQKQALL